VGNDPADVRAGSSRYGACRSSTATTCGVVSLADLAQNMDEDNLGDVVAAISADS
jgi:hypothetical protein